MQLLSLEIEIGNAKEGFQHENNEIKKKINKSFERKLGN